MASLVMLSPAPMIELPGGEVVLDVKFVEGMKLHCQLWPGTVRCVMRRGATHIDNPMRYSVAQLGFELLALDPDAPVPETLLDEAALLYVAADDMQYLDLPGAMKGRVGKLVYTVEDALLGRIRHACAATQSIRRRIGATWWNLRHEGALRRALRAADGVHFDGYPAESAYRRISARALRYHDNRMRVPMTARPGEQSDRATRLHLGEPLQLAWFGHVEPMSGAADLLQVAFLLRQRGVDFRLEMFGTGPLTPRIHDGIAALGLSDVMTLQEPGPFDPVLVPHLRKRADLFIAPRRLSSPQSFYIEALGCGLPIVGYANRTWKRMHAESRAGWVCRPARPGALAARIARLDRDRVQIIEASRRAVDFARANSFEHVFSRRMTDLRDIAGLD
ncbi:hypothetical protein C4N9_01665 [Pararhodobacter marinus]|uniref:Glycosyl transferase family 1 domain-containing protein n=1 Tax=Pararhodobacter marinus TaxID=2184063 RepID=A0A2U2CIP9_9RHOB|nr:glycosyltransferase [Pararhodobacter marinus]PWE31742.1 hypothetical protein C4N9_01665 [Pararhodobacter marinus]